MRLYPFFLLPCILSILLTACQFHLQGPMPLAKPLHRVYLESPEPYGQLTRTLKQYLLMSHAQLVESPHDASAVIAISRDEETQSLIGVSSTQQTRQYSLTIIITFEVKDKNGRVLLPSETLTEARTITIQSNQILGSSNEASLFYQQMRRSLAYSMMNRLASKEVTQILLREAP